MIANHYGHGLRTDEKPYAHKIPPGGNWRSLPEDEQRAFMKGSYGNGGGNSGYLLRSKWDAPAATVTATMFGKAMCQLHPGLRIQEEQPMHYNVTPQLPTNGLTVNELFAGGGLMAAGLRSAGYKLQWANDWSKTSPGAIAAYQHNYGPHIIDMDVAMIDLDSIPDADVFAGGPPCQDYSVAGDGKGEDGDRGQLVWTYLSIIKAKQPKAFIFENVKGLTGKKHAHTFASLLVQFEAIGYNVSWKLIMAWDYGVAQKRERVFIVGIRQDLGFSFHFPQPQATDYRTQVLRDVIGDLPEPMDNVGKRVKAAERKADMDEPSPTITTQFRCQTVELANHDPKQLSERAIDYLHSKDGRSLKKHRPPTLDEPGQTIVSNVAKGVPYGLFYPDNHERKDISDKAMEGYDRRGGEGGFGLRVNEWDEPSPTIFGRIFNEGKAFVHPGPLPENHDGHLLNNVNPDYNHRRAQEVYPMDQPSQTITAHSRNEGIHPGPLANHDKTMALATDADIIPTLPEGITGRNAAKLHPNIFWSNYTREAEANASRSVTGQGKPKIHPTQPRRFTVRECLRIQSVPDWYVLPDSISLSSQYRIVGNGVASRVAYLLGIALAEQLKEGAQ